MDDSAIRVCANSKSIAQWRVIVSPAEAGLEKKEAPGREPEGSLYQEPEGSLYQEPEGPLYQEPEGSLYQEPEDPLYQEEEASRGPCSSLLD